MESEAVRLLLLQRYKHPRKMGAWVEGKGSQKFWKVDPVTNCWDWLGYKNSQGYGYLWDSKIKKVKRAHRLIFEITKGRIPEKFTLDHLCRNTGCVNPEHLEAVSQRENILRSNGVTAMHSKKTHCIHGHSLSEGDFYVRKSGGRNCKECVRLSGIKRRADAREACGGEVKLKAYMVSNEDPEEGAILVFARSVKEAKKIGWPVAHGMMVEEFIDLRVKWLKSCPWLFDEAKSKKPHVIEDPKTCQGCETWGHKWANEEYCVYCEEENKKIEIGFEGHCI